MINSVAEEREGFIRVPGGNVWYRIVGSGDAIPLLTLHGGPGAGHDYLEPLGMLASDRPVVFYDQLGCGRSDQPNDSALWNMDRFVVELSAVREALGLNRIHLLGHSWGGWLAIESTVMSNSSGVASLILASTSASTAEFTREARYLRLALPPKMQETMQHYEAKGDLHNPDYRAVVMELCRHHLCRSDPWPAPLMRSVKNITGNPVNETMKGPSEMMVVGNLKDWNRCDYLGQINTPTLITVGRYDEVTPSCSETLHRGIAGSEIHVFEQSSHMPHLEETGQYLKVVRNFLRRVEK